MPSPNEDVIYGFNKDDANDLVQLIDRVEGTFTDWEELTAPGSSAAVFSTPAGGIPVRSGTTLGSATCTLFTVTSGTLTTTSTTNTVYNVMTTAVTGSVYIIAQKIDGIWVAIAEDCP